MPGVVEHDGQRLPATYVNFYFINGALLVPIYDTGRMTSSHWRSCSKHLPRTTKSLASTASS